MTKGTYSALIIVITVCLMVQDCFSTQWENTYGGGNDDCANFIQQTSDGGFIMAGYSESYGAGNQDVWILKLESNGTVSWQKTYGGGSNELANFIQQTADGGYIVAGWTNSFAVIDVWILKLDSDGNVSWQKTFGGSGDDRAYSIQQTSDGGYIVAGWTWSFGEGMADIWVLRLDSGGTVVWQKTLGGSEDDRAYSIQQTSDTGYIVAGETSSFGVAGNDMWVVKLDPTGNVSWQKTYGGSNVEKAYTIQQTTDGRYIVAGEASSFGSGSRDMWILKLEANGSIIWQKNFEGVNNDYASFARQTIGGGFIVTGYSGSFGSGVDAWVLNLDTEGNILWQKIYGSNGSDWARSIQWTSDGGYVMSGKTTSSGAGLGDVWVLKLDSNGDINNCDSIGTSAATVTDTAVSGITSTAIISSPSLATGNSPAVPQNTVAQVGEHCFAPDWFPSAPPSEDKLNGVWGYISSQSTHEFYAVGEEGTIIHFNGSSWNTTASHTLEDLYGIWGSSGTDIFAVGGNATIVRYDTENGWENVTHSLPTTNLNDVWGSSASDVYVVGEGGFIAHYNGSSWSEVTHSLTTETLTGIWGSAIDDYVVIGEGGTIITYDGSWTKVDPSPTTEGLSEVWGSAADNIYAVGTGGTIIHYDTSWNGIESPTSANLRGIWGSSADNIYAVGEHGTILYYDGTSWTRMDSGTQDSLISTFGTLNPRVMVVGYDGNILSLQGSSVQGKICNACTGEGISNVTVEFDRDKAVPQTVYTNAQGIYPPLQSQGGEHPILLTASGYIQKEITVDLPNNNSLVDHATYLIPNSGYGDCLSGTVTKTVFIGSEPAKENDKGVQNMVVKLFKGTTLRQTAVTDEGGNYHFIGLSAGNDYRIKPIITASECSTVPTEEPGITVPTTDQYHFTLNCPTGPPPAEAYWVALDSGTDRVLRGIWGSASDNIFAVGDGGTIIYYDGNDWSSQTSNTPANLAGVWGSSATSVYAVGAGGKVLKTENGGTTWSTMTSNTLNGLNAVWGSSATDIFAVGDGGKIIHGNGTSWTTMGSGTTVKLLGVFGNSGTDVYAVGNSHMEGYWKRTVLHYDGSWHTEETGNGINLMSSWGESSTDMMVAGSFGGILRYDGMDWKQTGGPTESTLNAMWGESASDIFAVGYAGVIAHYDGTAWSVRKSNTENTLYGIWGASATEVYAVGDRGTVLSYSGDVDDDGEPDITDNCPEIANPGQANSDEDTLGDACDNCPGITNENQANSDADSLGNVCDNCWGVSNASQSDSDLDCPGQPYTSDPKCGDACEFTGNDSDGDGIINEEDNCPTKANPFQEDSYPPQTDGIGDACECEGDFTCDGDVDADDVTAFLADFGREPSWRACGHPTWGACDGDFECDGDVDADDVSKFLEDFGREPSFKPCPACNPGIPWCVY